jgi:hypothetical protein
MIRSGVPVAARRTAWWAIGAPPAAVNAASIQKHHRERKMRYLASIAKKTRANLRE